MGALRGTLKGVPEALAIDLKARGALDVREAFIDGSFAPAKKGFFHQLLVLDLSNAKPSFCRASRSYHRTVPL